MNDEYLCTKCDNLSESDDPELSADDGSQDVHFIVTARAIRQLGMAAAASSMPVYLTDRGLSLTEVRTSPNMALSRLYTW